MRRAVLRIYRGTRRIPLQAANVMVKEFPAQLAANGTTVSYIDDEFEGTLSPETHPLPAVISACK